MCPPVRSARSTSLSTCVLVACTVARAKPQALHGAVRAPFHPSHGVQHPRSLHHAVPPTVLLKAPVPRTTSCGRSTWSASDSELSVSPACTTTVPSEQRERSHAIADMVGGPPAPVRPGPPHCNTSIPGSPATVSLHRSGYSRGYVLIKRSAKRRLDGSAACSEGSEGCCE
jgi:hypothetical protein